MERPKEHMLASATTKVLVHKINDSVPTAMIHDP